MYLIFQLATLVCLFITANKAILINKPGDVAIEFIILHNNDMYSRFEQTTADGGTCSSIDAIASKCYGGFARVAYIVRKFRDAADNGGQAVLFLNAGNTFTGTPWYTVFKDNILVQFMNKILPDAMSLGVQEFNEGVDGLVKFLQKVQFPVLASNLDLSTTPTLAAEQSLKPSTVFYLDSADNKVGVIGYLTPKTEAFNKSNPVIFLSEIESINKEAEKLKADGVNIIIALGSSGYSMDQEIARNCPEVDIVIGGHTKTFLYNGRQPDAECIDGPYPTIVKQPSGKEVPVVQAYAYTKYMGQLNVKFDKDGNLLECDGNPLLLNSAVPRASDVIELLEVYRPEVTALEKNIVRDTKVAS